MDLDLTHEAAYIDQISQQQVQSGWSPVRMYQPRNAKAEYPVVSLARRLPIPLGSDGYIVINISVYRLERLVDGLTNGELSLSG